MSTRNVLRLLALVTAAAAIVPCEAQQGPGLGTPISAADLAPWDISIQPDGAGLPPGSGNAAKGAEVYATHCVACHGAGGAGTPNDRLVGGQGTLDQLQQVRTIGSFWPYASTVFDYIRRAMPFLSPQSLSNEDVYAVTAYLLAENGIIEKNATLDAQSLARVRMPNRDGFIMAYPKRADR
jgi:S-disulfanyl-L-cysteine oxidoreductase SoxD